MEVIDGISAVIQIINTCVKVYEGVQKDLELPEAFAVVARRLPILSDTLRSCKGHLEGCRISVAGDVRNALDETLTSCEEKAKRLYAIGEEVIVHEGDGRMIRYKKIVSRLGKGSKIEELMEAITKDVQNVVNNDAVRSVQPEQVQQLENVLRELQSLYPSIEDEDGSSVRTQVSQTGNGQQFVIETMSGTQNYSWVIQPKDNFGFLKPIGVCLLPFLDQRLFIGRESDQDQMARMLRPNEKSMEQRRLVLGGFGGIGKTQLAIAYAMRYSATYESVIWLNATSEATLKTSFEAIAERIFEVKDHRILSNDQAVIHVRRWLSDERNTQWLLIYDNYDEPDSYDIQNYYPYATHGSLIVTTRLPGQVNGQSFLVRPLDRIEHSLRILEVRSQRLHVAADVHARRLAERLAGLPLALSTAGTYLRKSTWTFQRYLEEYEKNYNISPNRPLQLCEYQDRTLYTTWDITYRRLEHKDVEAAQFLKQLAYFGHQPIWEELFRGGIRDDLPKWLVDIANDSTEFDSVMQVLVDYCFLELQVNTKTYSMHTCIHDWILVSLNHTVEPWRYWYAFDCIANTMDQKKWDEEFDFLGHRRHAHLVTHAMRLTHERFQETRYEIAKDRIHKAGLLAQLLAQQTQPAAATIMLEHALYEHEKAFGSEHVTTLGLVVNLGVLYRDQGQLDQAARMFKRGLAAKEKIFGPEHEQTLSALCNLAGLYLDQGKLDLAEEMFERVLSGFEKILGPHHPLTLATLGNCGFLYFKQGKLDAAKSIFERALARQERILGLDHDLTLTTIGNLGNVYAGQGELDQAEKMYKTALARQETIFGSEHTSTLTAIHTLGYLYHQRGQLDESQKWYARALSGREKALGCEHVLTLDTKHGIGSLCHDLGQTAKAEQMFKTVLYGREKILGREHKLTVLVVCDLSRLYHAQNRLAEAEEMYKRVLDGYERELHREHDMTLLVVNELGTLYCKQGRLVEAEETYKRALAGCERVLDREHTSTLLVVNMLGLLYRTSGNLAAAGDMYQRVLSSHPNHLNEAQRKVAAWGLAATLSQQDCPRAVSTIGMHSRMVHLVQHVESWVENDVGIIKYLAEALMQIRDDENAAVACAYLPICSDGQSVDFDGYLCDGCGCKITMAAGWYHCRQCKGVQLCYECMVEYTLEGLPLSKCRDHEYFSVSAAVSQAVESPGFSGLKGMNLWLGQLRDKYELLNKTFPCAYVPSERTERVIPFNLPPFTWQLTRSLFKVGLR